MALVQEMGEAVIGDVSGIYEKSPGELPTKTVLFLKGVAFNEHLVNE